MELMIENEYLKTMSLFRITEKKEQFSKMMQLRMLVQDRTLKRKIEAYVKANSQLPETTQLKMLKEKDSAKILLHALETKRDLQQYVENIINGKKPYWQILAEQNGWVPKGEKNDQKSNK